MSNQATPSTNSVVSSVLGIGVLLCFGGLLWMFLRSFVASSPAIQAAIIAGFVTISGSVITIIYSARNQKRREIEAEHRKQKAEIYDNFMNMWFGFLHREKLKSEPVTEEELLEKMMEFTRKMIVWGSDEVLLEFIKFRDNATQSDSTLLNLITLENLILAMRRDLGHDNKYLKQTDVLRMFINDLDAEIYKGAKEVEHVVHGESLNESSVIVRSSPTDESIPLRIK